eukprot:s2926_g10.t1
MLVSVSDSATRFEAQTLSPRFCAQCPQCPSVDRHPPRCGRLQRADPSLKRKPKTTPPGRTIPSFQDRFHEAKREQNTRRLMFNPCVEGFFTATKRSGAMGISGS